MPEDPSIGHSSVQFGAIPSVSRVVGNLGAPLGPFDRFSEAEESEEGSDGCASDDVIVFSDDPLSVGILLESGLKRSSV